MCLFRLSHSIPAQSGPTWWFHYHTHTHTTFVVRIRRRRRATRETSEPHRSHTQTDGRHISTTTKFRRVAWSLQLRVQNDNRYSECTQPAMWSTYLAGPGVVRRLQLRPIRMPAHKTMSKIGKLLPWWTNKHSGKLEHLYDGCNSTASHRVVCRVAGSEEMELATATTAPPYPYSHLQWMWWPPRAPCSKVRLDTIVFACVRMYAKLWCEPILCIRQTFGCKASGVAYACREADRTTGRYAFLGKGTKPENTLSPTNMPVRTYHNEKSCVLCVSDVSTPRKLTHIHSQIR